MIIKIVYTFNPKRGWRDSSHSIREWICTCLTHFWSADSWEFWVCSAGVESEPCSGARRRSWLHYRTVSVCGKPVSLKSCRVSECVSVALHSGSAWWTHIIKCHPVTSQYEVRTEKDRYRGRASSSPWRLTSQNDLVLILLIISKTSYTVQIILTVNS